MGKGPLTYPWLLIGVNFPCNTPYTTSYSVSNDVMMSKLTDPTSSPTQYRTEGEPFRSPSPELLDPTVSLNSISVDSREEDLESFIYAARHGDIETIITLLESYYSGSQLSLNATRYIHIFMIQWETYFAPLNARENRQKNKTLFRLYKYYLYLFYLPSNNKSHGWTALHWAAYMGHDNIVELLLKNGASPNVQNDQGDTPLHKAAYTNRCSTVSLLLNYNCDVSLKNSLGKKAILFCENGDVRELLIGAARSQDKQKEILLLDVSKRGDLRAIQDLVDSPDPPSINCIDDDGKLNHCCIKLVAFCFLYKQIIEASIKADISWSAVSIGRTQFCPIKVDRCTFNI